MRWPFVPERWQYKETLSSQDKTNLSDLISHNLPQLMVVWLSSLIVHLLLLLFYEADTLHIVLLFLFVCCYFLSNFWHKNFLRD